MNLSWDGIVEVPWRAMIVLGVLSFGAVIFLLIALFEWVTQPPPISRRERLDRELDGAWDLQVGQGIQPDTLRMYRLAAGICRLERANAKPDVMLFELMKLEAALDDVGARLAPPPPESVYAASTTAAGTAEAVA